jgi:hypothetical protein
LIKTVAKEDRNGQKSHLVHDLISWKLGQKYASHFSSSNDGKIEGRPSKAPCISSLRDAIVQMQIQSIVTGLYATANMQELRAREA